MPEFAILDKEMEIGFMELDNLICVQEQEQKSEEGRQMVEEN